MLSWDNYKEWLGSDLIRSELAHNLPPAITEWVTDSRTIQPGQWFIALPGENYDGHDFVSAAVKAGAAGIVVNDSWSSSQLSSHPSIVVKNPRRALQLIAKGWRSVHTDTTALAITGSLGKTSTKELVTSILSQLGPTLASPGNFNNEIGVPKTLQLLRSEHQFAVLELGARNLGDIESLVDIVSPNVAACLNIGSSHLEQFGTRENLITTKLQIYSDPKATSVINVDDSNCLKALALPSPKHITFSKKDSTANVFSRDRTLLGPNGARLSLAIDGEELDVLVPFCHEGLCDNALAAAAIASAAGATLQQIKKGIEDFKSLPRRFNVIDKGELTVIDDTYNSHPDSVIAGLKSVSSTFPEASKILVIGDMLELGKSSKADHLSIGDKCSQLNPKLLITVGPNARDIAEGAKQSGLPTSSIISFSNVDEAISANVDLKKFGSVVYAKASKSVELHRFVNSISLT